MTIKEMESTLDIPRATIRFYEKEGLISPSREENGYRDYSKEDLGKVKKIVILRKIGFSVNDIADLFDEAKSLPLALEENIENLHKQMDELKGALNLCEKIKEGAEDIKSLNVDNYLNYIAEEEKQGHRFMVIAKDIVKTEKGVFNEWFTWTDINGDPYDSGWSVLRGAVITMAISGVIMCLYRKSFDITNFRDGALGILTIVALEALLSIPLYFLGKKHPWIAKNRKKALFISALILCALLILLDITLSV